jgi:amino acid transporter
MPYGPKGAIVGAGTLAATGFAVASWVIGAVTLLFLGFAVVQLARRAGDLRP